MDPSLRIDLVLNHNRFNLILKTHSNPTLTSRVRPRFGRVDITTPSKDKSPQCHRSGAMLLFALSSRSSSSYSTQPPCRATTTTQRSPSAQRPIHTPLSKCAVAASARSRPQMSPTSPLQTSTPPRRATPRTRRTRSTHTTSSSRRSSSSSTLSRSRSVLTAASTSCFTSPSGGENRASRQEARQDRNHLQANPVEETASKSHQRRARSASSSIPKNAVFIHGGHACWHERPEQFNLCHLYCGQTIDVAITSAINLGDGGTVEIIPHSSIVWILGDCRMTTIPNIPPTRRQCEVQRTASRTSCLLSTGTTPSMSSSCCYQAHHQQ